MRSVLLMALPLLLSLALLLAAPLVAVADPNDPNAVGGSGSSANSQGIVVATGNDGAHLPLGLNSIGMLVQQVDSGEWVALDAAMPDSLQSLAWAPDHSAALAAGADGALIHVGTDGT